MTTDLAKAIHSSSAYSQKRLVIKRSTLTTSASIVMLPLPLKVRNGANSLPFCLSLVMLRTSKALSEHGKTSPCRALSNEALDMINAEH